MRTLLPQAETVWELRRIQCVFLRAAEGKSAEEIAPMVGLHPGSVWRIWSLYMKEGDAALLGEKRGRARGNAHLTLEEERDILMSFLKKAGHGQLLTVRRVHAAVCQKIGRAVDPSITYRMLHRHGWRKITPLPTHPRGNGRKRERFRRAFSPTREESSDRSQKARTRTEGHV